MVKADPKKLHGLHLIIISRPEHLTLFELGNAKKVDFAFAGPQSLRVAHAVLSKAEIKALLEAPNRAAAPLCIPRCAAIIHHTRFLRELDARAK